MGSSWPNLVSCNHCPPMGPAVSLSHTKHPHLCTCQPPPPVMEHLIKSCPQAHHHSCTPTASIDALLHYSECSGIRRACTVDGHRAYMPPHCTSSPPLLAEVTTTLPTEFGTPSIPPAIVPLPLPQCKLTTTVAAMSPAEVSGPSAAWISSCLTSLTATS